MKIDHQQAKQDAFAHETWQKKMHKDLVARAKLDKLLFDTQMRDLKMPGFEAQFTSELQKQGFEPSKPKPPPKGCPYYTGSSGQACLGYRRLNSFLIRGYKFFQKLTKSVVTCTGR